MGSDLTAFAHGAVGVKSHGAHPDLIGIFFNQSVGGCSLDDPAHEHGQGFIQLGEHTGIDQHRRGVPDLPVSSAESLGSTTWGISMMPQ